MQAPSVAQRTQVARARISKRQTRARASSSRPVGRTRPDHPFCVFCILFLRFLLERKNLRFRLFPVRFLVRDPSSKSVRHHPHLRSIFLSILRIRTRHSDSIRQSAFYLPPVIPAHTHVKQFIVRLCITRHIRCIRTPNRIATWHACVWVFVYVCLTTWSPTQYCDLFTTNQHSYLQFVIIVNWSWSIILHLIFKFDEPTENCTKSKQYRNSYGKKTPKKVDKSNLIKKKKRVRMIQDWISLKLN